MGIPARYIVFFAKLTFISTGVVELFDFIVGVLTRIIFTGLLGPLFAVNMVIVMKVASPQILVVVVIEAEILIVAIYIENCLHYFRQGLVLKVFRSNLKNSENARTGILFLGFRV